MSSKVKKEQKVGLYDKIVAKRKVIMLAMIFILLPVICISWLYISEYNANKPQVFTDTKAKVVSKNYLKDKFDFNLYVSDYTEPVFEEKDGKVSTVKNGSLKIRVDVGNKIDTNISTNSISVKVVAAANWVNYTSSQTSTSVKFNGNNTCTISNFSEKWPQSPLWLVNVKKESVALYVLLTWSEKKDEESTSTEKSVIVKYKYNQYVTNNTVFK